MNYDHLFVLIGLAIFIISLFGTISYILYLEHTERMKEK